MISAELAGRLGNQMFIIAAAASLAKDNNDIVIFPDSISGIAPTKKEIKLYRDTIFRNFTFSNILPNMKSYYEPADLSYKKIIYEKNLFLRGYFQSEKYFKHNREHILDLFSPQKEIKDFILRKYSNIIEDKNCVSVHIRRGDYLELADYHANLGKEYYIKAMEKYNDAKFVFFSDDIEWCKNTFDNKNIFIENQPDVLDLFLMSNIQNNIIANSSFSWWGAWLNENHEKTVISPFRWFGPKNSNLKRADLTPNCWEVVV